MAKKSQFGPFGTPSRPLCGHPDSILAGFWHPCRVRVQNGVHRRAFLFKPLCFNTLEMKPVAEFGLAADPEGRQAAT
jgi:hypothetical protein